MIVATTPSSLRLDGSPRMAITGVDYFISESISNRFPFIITKRHSKAQLKTTGQHVGRDCDRGCICACIMAQEELADKIVNAS